MPGMNKLTLPIDAVLKVRDLYAERDPVRKWLPKYSHAQIAKMMDCSASTVARIVNREGAYAWVGGQSLGEAKADPQADKAAQVAAKASLERLQKLLTAQPVEDTPDPEAKISPETEAAAAAIRAKLGNL